MSEADEQADALHVPTAREMLDSAAAQNFALLGDVKTPAHVRAKAVDNTIKLAAAMGALDAPEVPLGADNVFEMIDGLPPERAVELLERHIATRKGELDVLETKLAEKLEQRASASA